MTSSGALKIEILSPARVMARVTADRINVPGVNGTLGILPGHAALVSELGVGELTVAGGELAAEQVYFVAGGYVEVAGNHVTVLVDVIEKREEIDTGRAEKAKQRAIAILSAREGEVDYQRAQAALKRAEYRLIFANSPKH